MKIKIAQEGKLPVSGRPMGLFLEDLNYAIDGGLHAEMLENRNFEAKDVHGEKDHYFADDSIYAWTPYPNGDGVETKLKSDRPLLRVNPHYLRLKAESGKGVRNKAYDGVYLSEGMKYFLSFYVRSFDYKGAILAGIFRDGALITGKRFKVKADGKWHRFSCKLKAPCDVQRGDFCLLLERTGTVHIDCFSLMPGNAIKGVFRRDLAELLKDLKPAFLRFPGGCLVEGNTLENRYNWKDTVTIPEARKFNWNRWALHGANAENGYRSRFSHYGQTLGIGFYEYFLLCEYLGCKPLPVVNLGMACQFMSTEFVPVDSPEFENYIQDALDLVEFANGATDTEWGSVRAEMGHPEPFGLELLGLGNEQWEEEVVCKDGRKVSNELFRRIELFEQRLHEKYPDLKLIGTVGPGVLTPDYERAWAFTREKLKKNPNFVFASDEHFYLPPEWFYAHTGLYDGYPREGKVFVGEYAAHCETGEAARARETGGPAANCWEAALAEAAFMTGMERNCDVVVMFSYAPLLARTGYAQWSPDLIWFDGNRVLPTANYYIQKLYSLYTGSNVLGTELDGEGEVYASASEREGLTFLKLVNSGEREIDVEAEGDLGSLTRIIRMQGEPADYNSFEMQKLVPYEEAPLAPRSCTLPPHSFSVLVFRK